MKRIIVGLFLVACATSTMAAEGGKFIQKAHNSLTDVISLQRGARLFVNYCVSCHSAAFMRYNRIAKDLKLSVEAVEDNLMFTTDRIGDPMEVAMRPADAEAWFGVAPPDLSVIARVRGVDWLYSFLLGFYIDPNRPTGVNNLVFPETAMPHVLWQMQGLQKPVIEVKTNQHGDEVQEIAGVEIAVPGELSESDYGRAVRDLVNFLAYVGEPAQLKRFEIGVWVMLYLFALLVVAYRLKREYWRNIH